MKEIVKQSQLPWINSGSNVIFLTLHGSRAYGIHTKNSDYDYKGIAIPPKEYFFGFLNKFEQNEISDPYDTVVYDLHKFMKLAADANPNIFEVLFVDDSSVVKIDKAGKKLRDNKNLFLSKKAKYSFSGYAHAQLKRIRTHRNWVLNPIEKKPTREDFGLPEGKKLLDYGSISAIEELQQNEYQFSKDVIALIQKEKQYKNALQQYRQYQHWLQTRNADRFKLERKYGYDTKHAGHLYRLLVQCEEVLKDGTLVVKRPDAKTIMSIKNGEWSYDSLIKWADEQEQKINELEKTSPLPKKPNMKKIDNLCMEIVSEFHEIRL